VLYDDIGPVAGETLGYDVVGLGDVNRDRRVDLLISGGDGVDEVECPLICLCSSGGTVRSRQCRAKLAAASGRWRSRGCDVCRRGRQPCASSSPMTTNRHRSPCSLIRLRR
jgi:hypothetical protein